MAVDIFIYGPMSRVYYIEEGARDIDYYYETTYRYYDRPLVSMSRDPRFDCYGCTAYESVGLSKLGEEWIGKRSDYEELIAKRVAYRL